jgi:hypothetical protein
MFGLRSDLHTNTIEALFYWEQMEPRQGSFDFSNVDLLVSGAREHHLRLILLWFGTWKNGQNHYVPECVKTNIAKYPRELSAYAKVLDVIAPHTKPTLDADSHAFAALMCHLRRETPPGTADESGRVLVGQIAPYEFLVTGFDARVRFVPPESQDNRPGNEQLEILTAEQGSYVDGSGRARASEMEIKPIVASTSPRTINMLCGFACKASRSTMQPRKPPFIERRLRWQPRERRSREGAGEREVK